MTRKVTIVHAPSPLGLKPPSPGRVPGVWRMPSALESAGLHQLLGVTQVHTVQPPEYEPDLDPKLGVRNHDGIAQYSVELADALGPLLSEPEFLLVLGGDCSIFIGTALAMRRSGKFGVIYIDAHSDCQTPEVSETGGVAGMPLGIATGRGPRGLTDLESMTPYIAEEDVLLLGVRDLFDVTGGDRRTVKGTRIQVRDLEDIRSSAPEMVALAALAELRSRGAERIWVHLDADVLNPEVMPAVDSPDPGGLFPDELTALLHPLMASPIVSGMQVTIYDPERDTDGRAGELLVDVLVKSFGSSLRSEADR